MISTFQPNPTNERVFIYIPQTNVNNYLHSGNLLMNLCTCHAHVAVKRKMKNKIATEYEEQLINKTCAQIKSKMNKQLYLSVKVFSTVALNQWNKYTN